MHTSSRAAHSPAYFLWLTLIVVVVLVMLTAVANGQQGGTASGQIQDEPVSPTNFPTVFTRIIGTDAWRGNIGGLRNVGSGTIGINGVNGTVTRAYLYWHGVTNSYDPYANNSVRVNGFTIFGNAIGTSYDNSWSYNVSQAYHADVTHLVGTSPNKSYLLSNFGSGTFNPNGAFLVIFYNDSNSANDYDVTILNGNDSNGASAYDPSGWDANLA